MIRRSRLRPRSSAVAALGAAALLSASAVTAATAAAAPAWLPPAPLELPVTALAQQLQIGFGGGRELYALAPASGAAQEIAIFAREPGAGTGALPARQAAFPSVTGGDVVVPRLAVAPGGAAVLAWIDSSRDAGRPLLMRAAYRTADGAWQQPVTVATAVAAGVSLPGELPPFGPSVAIGADGTAAVLAQHGEDNSPGEQGWDARLDAVVHRPGAGGWERSVRLSTPDRSVAAVNVAVAESGEVTAAWAEVTDEGASTAQADDVSTVVARRWGPSNGIWDALQDVAQAGLSANAREVVLGVAPDGAAIVAYEQVARGLITARAALRAPGAGTFATPRLVPTRRVNATPIAAAIAPGGIPTVLWHAPVTVNGADAGIGVTRAAGDGSWGAPRLLSAYAEQRSNGAIVTTGTDMLVAWSASGGAQPVVQGVRWQAGADAPDPVRDLDDDGGSGYLVLDQLVADGEGGAVATIERGDGQRTAVFDGGAPLLRAADVPPIAYAGLPVTLTADVRDRWSPLAGTPSWEFGDGSAGASGASVTHTFAGTGVVTVTLRAQDALGNALVRSFAVQVVAPTSAGGGSGGGAPTPPPRRAVATPRATLAPPVCPRAIVNARPRNAARARCARWLRTRAAWRTVRGTASGTTRVELRLVTPAPARGGTTRAARRRAAARTVTRVLRAPVRNGAWTLRLPVLRAGAVTLTLRPLDAAGKPAGTAVVNKLRLR
ncbi:PKD domain-containing protein [Conexibacter stalactiti]|uniref:PKD domain-containing protein n=1 Tax=Conexibacter stalactiti TaxID=1940611 RepID=A0ABU4HUT9_9ACTN|nr:PKD domain-containing protein [Conexibacter stalactiti]MDW5597078.1 PKD domain-containing protein [Conexibacter stalactiti]MEC5037720.1 PKD domain-containing protein [Conexibacter stalactiti]